MHRRTPLRMGPLRFRDPVLLCGVLYGLLLFDASGFLRTGLLAAFLHEWGHISCTVRSSAAFRSSRSR